MAINYTNYTSKGRKEKRIRKILLQSYPQVLQPFPNQRNYKSLNASSGPERSIAICLTSS